MPITATVDAEEVIARIQAIESERTRLTRKFRRAIMAYAKRITDDARQKTFVPKNTR